MNRFPLALLLFALSALAPSARADAQEKREATSGPPPAVIMVQESNGFPGGEKATKFAKQIVTIQAYYMQVIDMTNGYAFYVDLANKQVFELDVVRKQIVHRPFAYYDKYKKQRRESLADQAAEFKRGLKRRDGDVSAVRKWKEEYRKGGGDPEAPGRLVAKLQHYPNESKKIEILVDRKPVTVTAEHYVIRENQCDQPIFDLWVTKDVKLPVDVLRFYRELGTFSEPVTQKLLAVKGTILECKAVLDTGSFQRVFKTKIREVRNEQPRKPPVFNYVELVTRRGFTFVDPDKKQTSTPASADRTHTCPSCNKTSPATDKDWTTFREPWGRKRAFAVHEGECRQQLVRRLVAEQKGK